MGLLSDIRESGGNLLIKSLHNIHGAGKSGHTGSQRSVGLLSD